jgi:hypothetical protein
MKKIKVRITFTEEILGTASGDPKLHEEFVASKAPMISESNGMDARSGERWAMAKHS